MATATSNALRISVAEAFGYAADKIKTWFGEALVPTKERLDIVIKRMKGDLDEKRRAYHAALQAEIKVQHPEHPDEGSLADLQKKYDQRDKQGNRWGTEVNEGARGARKTELMARLNQCSAEMEVLEREIAAAKVLLKTLRDTTAMRKKMYLEAKTAVQKLETIAPAIVQQTEALRQAQNEKLAAAEAAKSGAPGTSATTLIAALQGELETAQAGFGAAEMIELESTDGDIDLDALDDAETGEDARDARVQRWITTGNDD